MERDGPRIKKEAIKENEILRIIKNTIKVLNEQSIITISLGLLIGLFSAIFIYLFENRVPYIIGLIIMFVLFIIDYNEGKKNLMKILLITMIAIVSSEIILFQSIIFDREEIKVYIQTKEKEMTNEELTKELKKAIIASKEKNIIYHKSHKIIEIHRIDNNKLIEKYENLSKETEKRIYKIKAVKKTKVYVPLLKYKTHYKYIY